MTQYISIKDASEMSGKSIQTIRRMIKSKKLRYRKDRTPQGFNYLIELSSLAEMSKISPEQIKETLSSTTQDSQAEQAEVSHVEHSTAEVKHESSTTTVQNESESQVETNLMAVAIDQQQSRSHQQIVSYEPIKELNNTMQKLIDQHGKEKENLFRLIETFQNKVISLENKIKVESGSKKAWFKIW